MSSVSLPPSLALTWPWLFGGTVLATGWSAIEVLVLHRGTMALYSVGHVLWFVAAPCILAIFLAHFWLIAALALAIAKKAPFPWYRILLLAIGLLPLYLPQWLWEMWT